MLKLALELALALVLTLELELELELGLGLEKQDYVAQSRSLGTMRRLALMSAGQGPTQKQQGGQDYSHERMLSHQEYK